MKKMIITFLLSILTISISSCANTISNLSSSISLSVTSSSDNMVTLILDNENEISSMQTFLGKSISLPLLEKRGHTFVGWTNLNGDIFVENIIINSESDLRLKSTWSKNEYNLNLIRVESYVVKIVPYLFSNIVLDSKGKVYLSGTFYLGSGGERRQERNVDFFEITDSLELNENEIISDLFSEDNLVFFITSNKRVLTINESKIFNSNLNFDNYSLHGSDISTYFRLSQSETVKEVIKSYYLYDSLIVKTSLNRFLSIGYISNNYYLGNNNTVYLDISAQFFNNQSLSSMTSHLTLLENGKIFKFSEENKKFIDITDLFGLEENENERIIEIYQNRNMYFALTSNYRFFAWGYNGESNLGLDNFDIYVNEPMEVKNFKVPSDESVLIFDLQFWADYYTLFILTNNNIYSYGYNGNFMPTSQYLARDYIFVNVTSSFDFAEDDKFLKLISTPGRYFLFTAKGDILAWGNNGFDQRYNQLGKSFSPVVNTPITISSEFGCKVSDMFFGYESSFAVCDNSEVYSWGLNSYGQLGSGNITAYPIPQKIDNFLDIVNKTTTSYKVEYDEELNGLISQFVEGSRIYMDYKLEEPFYYSKMPDFDLTLYFEE
jgi:uncharacterized repeat protein (TIGR02543 family)